MDKTIEVVLVATVALIVASIAIFLARGQADDFSGFISGSTTDEKCGYWKSQVMDAAEEEREDILTKMNNNGCEVSGLEENECERQGGICIAEGRMCEGEIKALSCTDKPRCCIP